MRSQLHGSLPVADEAQRARALWLQRLCVDRPASFQVVFRVLLGIWLGHPVLAWLLVEYRYR